jgi:alkylation response protein AidB-like acyl-CoA dehydrogenase
MPGFDIGPKEDKLGIRGSGYAYTQFNDVKVPGRKNRIGEEGSGLNFAMKTSLADENWDRVQAQVLQQELMNCR